MDHTVAKALDEALAISEEALELSLGLQTKLAEAEGKLVGENVLLEKVASLTKKAEAVIAFDPGLIDQAALAVVKVGGLEPGDEVKLASTIRDDPNAVLQMLIKVASRVPQFRAMNEGGGVKPEKPTEGDGRWV